MGGERAKNKQALYFFPHSREPSEPRPFVLKRRGSLLPIPLPTSFRCPGIPPSILRIQYINKIGLLSITSLWISSIILFPA